MGEHGGDVRRGIVVDAPVRSKGHDDTEQSLEDEDPCPSRLAAHSVHLGDASCQDAAEGAREGCGAEEEGHSEAALVTHIPLGDEVIDARKQTAFENTQNDPRRHQAGVVLYEALTDHGDGPAEHDEGEPDGGASALHHHVGRDLGSDVEREQDGQAVVVLQSMELEILLQMVKTCIANVGAVQKAQAGQTVSAKTRQGTNSTLQIDERHERDDVPVQLAQELLRVCGIPSLSLNLARSDRGQ